MTDLKIDKDKREIEMTLMLKGESEPIRVVLRDYKLDTSGEKATISFAGVSVSRPWMEMAAMEFLRGRALPVPGLAAKALMMVL